MRWRVAGAGARRRARIPTREHTDGRSFGPAAVADAGEGAAACTDAATGARVAAGVAAAAAGASDENNNDDNNNRGSKKGDGGGAHSTASCRLQEADAGLQSGRRGKKSAH